MSEDSKSLIKIRDIINEMESGFIFKENVNLCFDRIAKIMSTLLFSDEKNVVCGEIIKHKYTENELKAMGRVGQVVDVDDDI